MKLSTGLSGLDRVLRGLMPGDNLVWQVESLDDFLPFVAPFCQTAAAQGGKLVYFRFADHEPLVPEALPAAVHRLRTGRRIRAIHHRHPSGHSKRPGRGRSSSSIASRPWPRTGAATGCWAISSCSPARTSSTSSRWPISPCSATAIRSTPRRPSPRRRRFWSTSTGTRGSSIIHPTKVQRRYSATMYMLHRWDGDLFLPVTESSTTAEILTSQPWAGLESVRLRLGKWTRTFLAGRGDAGSSIRRGERPAEDADRLAARAAAHGHLARRARCRGWWPTLPDAARRAGHLETHDRHGTDRRQVGGHAPGPGDPQAGRPALERAAGGPRFVLRRLGRLLLLPGRERLLVAAAEAARPQAASSTAWTRPADASSTANFPEYLVKEFAEMLDYFGQSPIIVRSSSLLEDNYGNAFAGKYESVFCANQGPHHKRLAGLPLRREDDLRQHDEREGPALPRPARAAGPGRADVAVGAAGLRRRLRQPVLSAGGRRGPLAQPLRLERVHRPGGRRGAAGVRAGHAGGGPLGRRLHADRGPERPRTPPGKRFRRGPPVLAAEGRRDRPGGEPVRLPRLHRGGRAQLPPAGPHLRLAGRTAVARGRAGRDAAGQPRPGAHLRRAALADAVRRRHARDAPHLAGRLRLSRGHRVHRQFLRPASSTRSTWCSAGRCRSPRTAPAVELPKTIRRGRPHPGGPRRGDRPEPGEPDRPAGVRRAVGLRRASAPGALLDRPLDRPAAAPGRAAAAASR